MPTLKINAELSKEDLLKAAQQLNPRDLEQFTKEVLKLKAQQNAQSLPEAEAELLLKINQGLDLAVKKRYQALLEKRDTETLSHNEYMELLKLTDIVEDHQAKRLKYLAELAKLRKISLTELMEQLDINPSL